MKTIIIEDENIAAQNLVRLLGEVAPDIEVECTLQSVEESVEFFSHANDIELVFMDIHLADGSSFNIFDSVKIDCPIVFTTAYDQYALDAFKVNSIDYLLKPIQKDDLERAVEKIHRIKKSSEASATLSTEQIGKIVEMMQQKKKYKSFFLIPLRDKLVPLDVNEIAYIYLDDKISRAVTYDNQSFAIDKPLDAIFTQLDPAKFFRANRQYIISHNSVAGIAIWPLSTLHVVLKVETPEKIIVSRARAAEFKDWYTE